MTETVTLNTQTLLGAEDAAIEIFEVPASRLVHGKSFPLGIKPKEGSTFANVDDAVECIAKRAEEGVFNSLLTNRPFFIPDVADTERLTCHRWCHFVPWIPTKGRCRPVKVYQSFQVPTAA